MVDKATIRIGFTVYVVDCIECAFETFVNSDSVTFCFVTFIIPNDCSIHLCFLVDVG